VVVVYDPATHSAKFYYDNSLKNTHVITALPASIGQTVLLSNTTIGLVESDLIVDEFGLRMNQTLSASDIDQMWNAGSGARPPWVP
jgi:hypothetical protein